MAKVVFDKVKCIKPSSGGGDDQAYLKVIVNGDKVCQWPTSGYRMMGRNKTRNIGLMIETNKEFTAEMWEYDSGSGDDLLGKETLNVNGMRRDGFLVLKSRKEQSEYHLYFRVLDNSQRYVRLIETLCIACASGVDTAAFTAINDLERLTK